MSFTEVLKRLLEYLTICFTQIKYRNPEEWPYKRFVTDDIKLMFHPFRYPSVECNCMDYWIYSFEFNLSKNFDWYFTGDGGVKWPNCHWARIDYRPGNAYGDVRINWELNRLQFLPRLAVTNEEEAIAILNDWMDKNTYLHGPSYISAMEVALRWISIYWAACLLRKVLDPSLKKRLCGLCVASGKYIEKRLSRHSSAGNHLIVEAVGLFWIGKALGEKGIALRWLSKSREILWTEVNRQLNPDGTNREQSFWYLGFVLDALLHYFLLEEKNLVPQQVWDRVEKALEFVAEMTLPDGSFADYGDRDDGVVFRVNGRYEESPFPGLLNTAALFFGRPDWYRDSPNAKERLYFWTGKFGASSRGRSSLDNKERLPDRPRLKTYPDGGMSLMKWGKGLILFRHAPLGSGTTFAHGHADALSILLYWDNVPVMLDLGSGQYNGDQEIRNYFRSTIAHNTVELGQMNQAKILGPFLWEKSYEVRLERKSERPRFLVEASHNGYIDKLGIRHTRLVEWIKTRRVEVHDSFFGPGATKLRGAFHLGAQSAAINKGNKVGANFGHFSLIITFPTEFSLELFHGSTAPFIGWRSIVYGKWEPIYSVIFSTILTKDCSYTITLEIHET